MIFSIENIHKGHKTQTMHNYKKLRFNLPGFLCLFFLPTLVLAADNNTEGGWLNDYFGSMTGGLAVHVDFHPKNATTDVPDDPVSLWTQLALTNYVNFTDSLRLETELVFSATLPNLENDAFLSPGIINPDPPYVDFRTLMLTWQGENTAIKLGKGVIELGYAEIYSPVDRFRSQNYSKPQHFDGNDRGDVQISITRFFGNGELSLTMLPFHEDFIDPPGESRWLNSRGDRDFFSQIGAKDEDRPHKFPEDWGYLLQYTGIGNGFDYYLAAHHGPGAYPVVKIVGIVIPPDTVKFYPTATTGLAGINGTSGAWSYYVDIMYQKTHSNEDDTFVSWIAGVSYRETKLANRLGLTEIKPVLSYSGHEIVDDSDVRAILHNSEAARPHPDSLLTRVDLTFNDKNLLYFVSSVNFKDDDSSFGFGYQYRYNDALVFSARGLFMHGEDNTQFGRWRTNDFISVGLDYRF